MNLRRGARWGEGERLQRDLGKMGRGGYTLFVFLSYLAGGGGSKTKIKRRGKRKGDYWIEG